MSAITLYSFPFACSLAVRLVLTQHDVPFQTVTVERGPARKVKPPFDEVNPKRKVPTLDIDGERHTEIVAILHELDGRFVPDRSAADRRRHLEWLSFLATEVHQAVLGPWFDRDTPEAARLDARDRILPPLLPTLEAGAAQGTLLGGEPRGADAYLLWAVLLLAFVDRELVTPPLAAFRDGMLARPWCGPTVAKERERLRG